MSLVFVYGTLKRECSNHHILGNSLYVGNAVTVSAYTMWTTYFPHIARLRRSRGGLSVEGEVYDVDEFVLRELDTLEGHPRFYYREGVYVDVTSGISGRVFRVPVWIYLRPLTERIKNSLVIPNTKGRLAWYPPRNYRDWEEFALEENYT